MGLGRQKGSGHLAKVKHTCRLAGCASQEEGEALILLSSAGSLLYIWSIVAYKVMQHTPVLQSGAEIYFHTKIFKPLQHSLI